jgi:thymidylate kinase
VIFYSNYKRDGRFYFSSKELLDNRFYKYEKNYWQLNYTYSFIYYLIKKIDKKIIHSEQFIELVTYWTNAKASIAQNLGKFFNKKSIAIICKSFDEKDFNYLNTNFYYINKDLHRNVPKSATDIVSRKLRLLKEALKPSGLVVGILGRDGCGKSTFVSEISAVLGSNFREINSFKKFPAFFYKKEIFKKKEVFEVSKPHHYKKRSRLSSFIKLNFLLAEFIFGYWFKIYPLKVKSHLILFDRYFIDILADPLRYRIKASRFSIKVFHYLMPKPDLWIIIDLPSDVLLKRKQELSYGMAEKLRYEYLNLHKFLPNSIVINNNEEINKTVLKASTFILNYMHQKIA